MKLFVYRQTWYQSGSSQWSSHGPYHREVIVVANEEEEARGIILKKIPAKEWAEEGSFLGDKPSSLLSGFKKVPLIGKKTSPPRFPDQTFSQGFVYPIHRGLLLHFREEHDLMGVIPPAPEEKSS